MPEIGEGSETGTGYLDVFSVGLTERSKGYYWDLPNILIHPLSLNPDLILANNMQQPWWGGENFRDHLLETNNDDLSFSFSADPSKEYYLTLEGC